MEGSVTWNLPNLKMDPNGSGQKSKKLAKVKQGDPFRASMLRPVYRALTKMSEGRFQVEGTSDRDEMSDRKVPKWPELGRDESLAQLGPTRLMK